MIYKYLLPAGVILALLAGAYYRGASDKEIGLTAKYQQAYIDQFEHHQALQAQLQAQADQASAQHAEEMLNVQENIDAMLDHVRTERVYVRTQTPCATVPQAAGDQTGSRTEESRAELHPEVVANLIKLTRECDALAVDFNYLQSMTTGR